GASRDAGRGAERELPRLFPPPVPVEALGPRGRGPAVLDGGDVALGGADVPVALTGEVPVGGAADRQVLPHRPVEEVVPAGMAGSGPVGDLVPLEARRLEALGGPL